MPANTVKVDRTTRWGNPFVVGRHGTQEECVSLFAAMLAGHYCVTGAPTVVEQEAYRARVAAEIECLRGKNLACWCRPGMPCHADVLIGVANDPA